MRRWRRKGEADLANAALVRRREIGLEEAARYFEERGGEPLDETQLSALDADAVGGWRVSTEQGTLFVVVDKKWPFSAPEVFIEQDHPRIKGPHVEKSGKLCLAPPHTTYSQADSGRLLAAVIAEAQNLLMDSSRDEEQFSQEFCSYWLRDMEPSRLCLSLLIPTGPSRNVSCWHGEKFSVGW